MSLILPGSLVFDIGANVGAVAHQFLAAGANKVVCVEPCFENYLHLTKQSGIIGLHAAAWNKQSLIPVRYCPNTCGWSTCQPEKWIEAYPGAKWDEPQWTPAITLDGLIETFGMPHLIKVDVEGSEFEVLSALTSKPEYVIFEFHHKFMDDAVKVLELLIALGFSKAHYTRNDIDLDTVPITLLDEFKIRWLEDKPQWGNITVT